MAELSTQEKLNIALKMSIGVQGLDNLDGSSGKAWYEEKYAWEPFLINQEVFMTSVPNAPDSTTADAMVAANPTVIQKATIKLSLVPGTNGQAWAAYTTYNDSTSALEGDWLLPMIFGQGYAMRLFQDNGSVAPGNEITTTQGAWIVSYKLGIVILGSGFTATNLNWTTPLWAQVYRYIGPKGISGSTAGVSLQNAYENGQTITVDNGPVTLSATNGGAPIQLSNLTSAPTQNLSVGQLAVVNGVLVAYDSTRNKWLSVDRTNVAYFARFGNGNYLSSYIHSDINAGFTALTNGTITGVSAAGGVGNQTKTFYIRKNGSTLALYTLQLVAGKFTANNLNIDFNQGDVLQIFCSPAGDAINSPNVTLNVASRTN
jgi:hypothetical protein